MVKEMLCIGHGNSRWNRWLIVAAIQYTKQLPLLSPIQHICRSYEIVLGYLSNLYSLIHTLAGVSEEGAGQQRKGIQTKTARGAAEYSSCMIGDVNGAGRNRILSIDQARAKARLAVVPGGAS